jgi:hypothetical protein
MGIKITTEITNENDDNLRKACYLGKAKKKDVIDEALKIGLEEILKRLEEKQG